MNAPLPWNKLNDFIIDCGRYRAPTEFSKRVMNRIDALLPFDQARLYFLDDNGVVCDECLVGVDKQTVRDYHEYYSQVDGGKYALRTRVQACRSHYPTIEECVWDWSRYGSREEFFKEYVRPHQIRHSFGLGLRDLHNTMRCIISLDRVRDIKYSEAEIEIMRVIRPHLDNLYQNFYVAVPDIDCTASGDFFENAPLTGRELEVAALLTKGVLPANISNKLCISITTVNKHIANMHAKLNVSTRQELIVKLLHRQV